MLAFIALRFVAAWIIGYFMLNFFIRLISSGYIDHFGPLYSDNLKRNISGNDSSLYYLLALACTLIPFIIIFNRSRLDKLCKNIGNVYPDQTIRIFFTILVAGSSLYVLLLYADMLWRGIIPIVECMERYDYYKFSGPFHLPTFHYGPIAFMIFGGATIFMKLRGGAFDIRFPILLVLIVGYTVLTGHRFSAPIVFLHYFSMPLAVLVAARQGPFQMPIRTDKQEHNRRNQLREFIPILLTFILVILLVFAALLNSYTRLRSYGCRYINIPQEATQNIPRKTVQKADLKVAQSRVTERIMLQPGEMWVEVVKRMKSKNGLEPQTAFRFLFVAPGLDGGDVGIRYLMARTIGSEEEAELFLRGQQFQGGYPGIFIEMFGAIWSWPAILFANLVMAGLLFWWIQSLITGRFITFCLISYTYFAMVALYSSGSMTFLISWTFWMKLLFSLIAHNVEASPRYQSLFIKKFGLSRAD